MNSEGTCFGVTTLPLKSMSYSGSNFWGYRCYSGALYAGGSETAKIDKMHPGSKVECELDCDAGVLTFAIDGVPAAHTVTGLAGKTVYPAVQFYMSSSQRVECLGVTTPMAASSTNIHTFAVTLLSDLGRPDSRGILSREMSRKFFIVRTVASCPSRRRMTSRLATAADPGLHGVIPPPARDPLRLSARDLLSATRLFS